MDVKNLKPGDVLLIRGSTILDDLIKDVGKSSYSHSAIYIGGSKIIEAEYKVRISDLFKYKGIADIFRYENLTKQQSNKIIKYGFKKVGSKYDYLLLIWELIYNLFHISLPYNEGNKKFICSTLVNNCFKKAKIRLCPNIKYPSPANLSLSKYLKFIGSI